MDRFEQMSVFVAIAERGGFIGAARHLGLSAASVTRAVRALEGHLGTPLLLRTTRSVRMTDAGERYLLEARRLLAELEEIEELGTSGSPQLRGLLSITAPKMFGILHISPLLTEFLHLHPRLRGRLVLRDEVVDMKEEAIDVSVRISHAVEPTLICADLGRVRRVTVASPLLLARLGQIDHPQQLEGLPLIASGVDFGREKWTFEQHGLPLEVPLRPTLAITTNDSAIDAALAGVGIARVMSYQVAELLSQGRLCRLLAGFEPRPLPVRLLALPSRRDSPKVSAFVDFAAGRLGAHPALH